MSAGIPVESLLYPLAAEQVPNCDPGLIEVIVPIDTGTVAEAVAEVRGGVRGDRNTLAALSDDLDAQDADLRRFARRRALIAALAFR